MASLDDINSTQKGGVQNLSLINKTLQSIFPRITGTFTLANATSTVVAQNSIAANSAIFFTPTNAAAIALGALGFTAINPGVSFTATAGTMATGTETYSYFVVNPA